MTELELADVAAAMERAKDQATLAYEFCPGSYTYHAYVACLNAHRIVAEVVARMEARAA
jgi:hypothetical protein